MTKPTFGQQVATNLPIIMRVKRLRHAISRACCLLCEPHNVDGATGYRVSLDFNSQHEAQAAHQFLSLLVAEDASHDLHSNRRELTEDDAMRIAMRVYLEDYGPPQEQIKLMPRELVQFFKVASREYVQPRDHIAHEIAHDVRDAVAGWLREAANEARTNDPDVGIYPNEAQAVLFERLAAEVERKSHG